MADLGYYKMHALIVDDFENFRGTLNKMLVDAGIGHVDSAPNGEEALRLCKTKTYDLILCDNNLGKGKSGQQVLEELRTTKNPCSNSVFILVSAESSKSSIMAAYDFEPDAYLAKPITQKALDQRLTRALEQRNALSEVFSAQKNGDRAAAIEACKRLITSGNRYANHCQKILGQLYLENKNVSAAEDLYRRVLDVREVEWAQIGMVKTKIAQQDLIGAQQWLENIFQTNPMCLKAYDLQAEIYRQQNDLENVQSILQKATEISPLSIVRQQQLGEAALENNDLVTAVRALRHAVKLGENSCFDRPNVHSEFAQATINLHAVDKTLAKPILRDALACVSNLENKFGKKPAQKVEALLLESQLQVCNGDDRRAQDMLAAAKSLLSNTDDESLFPAEIELVRALRTLGKPTEAQEYLNALLTRYASDENKLQQLDVLLDEPQSEKNKKMVAEINKQGIALHKVHDYTGAANAFKTALQKLPNHVGLQLNYVQASLDKLKDQFDPLLHERIKQTFVKASSQIAPQHPQYQRYRQLQDAFNALVRDSHEQAVR